MLKSFEHKPCFNSGFFQCGFQGINIVYDFSVVSFLVYQIKFCAIRPTSMFKTLHFFSLIDENISNYPTYIAEIP